MSSISKTLKEKTENIEKNAFKIGKPVQGIKAKIPTKNGKEEEGLVIYKRKAEYRFSS